MDSVEAAEVVESVALMSEASQEANCHIFTLALLAPGYMELVEAARAAAYYWARKKDSGALARVDDQYLAHEVVTVVKAANGDMVDRVAHAALVAAAEF